MAKNETYPGGYDAMMQRVQSRRDPLVYAEGESLPSLDEDLTPLLTRPTTVHLSDSGSTFAGKRRALQKEFEGQPELLMLHGLVIANLRKNDFPAHAPALYQKMWAEHGEFLIQNLPLRWLVSAVTTFGDQGINEAQRHIGRSMMLMFGMIKLYEFERLYSGHHPCETYPTTNKINTPLPLGIPSYSLIGGGLDVAILTRLWSDADEDPIVKPLARHLLNEINTDPDTLFRRLRDMAEDRKQRKATKNTNPIPVPPRHVKRDPKTISWGVATTLNEDLDQAVCFTAHHLDLGADAVALYADNPHIVPHELAHHPRVHLVVCDDTVISAEQRKNMSTRNMRKVFYFNKARRNLSLDWLAMLDTDEYLIPNDPIKDILSQVPADAAFMKIPVVEQFADSPTLFRPPASTYEMDPNLRADLFPLFGNYLPDLILGQPDPRLFVRARLSNIRVANFIVKHNKRIATNAFFPENMVVAHCHADSFNSFINALPRRIDQGYSRHKEGAISINSALEATDKQYKKPELQRFFNEIAVARPEVVKALAAHNVLRTIDFDIEKKIERIIQEFHV